MAFYKQDIVDVNLETGVIHRSFLNHTIGHKDDDADRFGIRAFRNGEPVELSGAQCQAVFMAPDGTNIALTSYGTVSGNEAYVTLPQACYDVEGQFCLAIKLVGGGVTATVRIIDGVVDRTGATGAVAPTEAVPTYQEILAVYAQMQEDVADYESVVANQNGKIDDLKSALSFLYDTNLFIIADATDDVRIGIDGSVTSDAGYYASDWIEVEPNTTYIKNSPIQDAYHRVAYYNSAKTFISQTGNNISISPNNAKYARFSGIIGEKSSASFCMATAKDDEARKEISVYSDDLRSAINSYEDGNITIQRSGLRVDEIIGFDTELFEKKITVTNSNIVWSDSGTSFYLAALDSSKTLISVVEAKYSSYSATTKQYTLPDNTKYIRVVIQSIPSATVSISGNRINNFDAVNQKIDDAITKAENDLALEAGYLDKGEKTISFSGTSVDSTFPYSIEESGYTIQITNTSISYYESLTCFLVQALNSNDEMLNEFRKVTSYSANSVQFQVATGCTKIRVYIKSNSTASVVIGINKVQSITDAYSLIEETVRKYISEEMYDRRFWVNGTYAAYDGSVVPNAARMHMNDLSKITGIKCDSSHSVLLYGWDETGTYQGYLVKDKWQKTDAIWVKEYDLTVLYNSFKGYTFRVAAKKDDDSNIDINTDFYGICLVGKRDALDNVRKPVYEFVPSKSAVAYGSFGYIPSALVLDFQQAFGIIYSLQCLTSDSEGNLYVFGDRNGVGYVMKYGVDGHLEVKTISGFMLHGSSAIYNKADGTFVVSSREGATSTEQRNCYIYNFDTNTILTTFEYPTVPDKVGALVWKLEEENEYLLVYSDLATRSTLTSYIYNIATSEMEYVSDSQLEYAYMQDGDIIEDNFYLIDNEANNRGGEIAVFNWKTGERLGTINTYGAELEGCSIRCEDGDIVLYYCDNTWSQIRKMKIQ